MSEGEFENAVVGDITDRLLVSMGHSTEVSEKRSALFAAVYDWRERYHHGRPERG